jgi:formyl-CoA transferase
MADPVALGRTIGSTAIEELGTWEAAAENRALVFSEVTRLLPDRTTEEWMSALDPAGIWCGPVHRYEDLPHVEQIQAEGYFVDVPLPGGGTFRCPDGAVRFTGHPDPSHRPPPRLGEHDAELLPESAVGREGDEHG